MERYKKCYNKDCQWYMGENHGDYTYLDNACYLSGAFKLDCPAKPEGNKSEPENKI
jgi:hypothetical protein